MTNRGKVELLTRANQIRDKFYAGDCSRETAYRCVSALICEMLPRSQYRTSRERKLKAALITIEFMEPAV